MSLPSEVDLSSTVDRVLIDTLAAETSRQLDYHYPSQGQARTLDWLRDLLILQEKWGKPILVRGINRLCNRRNPGRFCGRAGHFLPIFAEWGAVDTWNLDKKRHRLIA